MREPKIDLQRWMGECLALAKKGTGRVSPNPMVGAILVGKGRVLARGYHRSFGGPHAEATCLDRFSGNPSGATLYVNLEPCAHHGKTPPCTDRIIRSGIRQVVIGMEDPNPLVAGRGIRALRRAGIRTTVGVLEDECRDFNRLFIHHITKRLPFVHLKLAQSLDGKIAGVTRADRWISSVESRRLVHSWRASHDAVLVGAGTVSADNPRLNVRLVSGRDPAVIVIDGQLSLSQNSQLFQSAKERRIFLCTGTQAIKKRTSTIRQMENRGVQVLKFPDTKGRISLSAILRRAYENGIASILIEGGSNIAGGFFCAGLVDQLSLFIAPRVLGKGVPAFHHYVHQRRRHSRKVERVITNQLGPDLLVQYFFR